MKKNNAIFITGTDTGVGKTIATYALGVLLQSKGIDIGVMKPVQCAGDDALFLKEKLNIDDPLDDINPYFANEPLSPHLAFSRAKKKINSSRIINIYQAIKQKHDLTLIEGAGGLMVPLGKDCLVADLIRAMNAPIIIVARLGLGTINHTLLTISQAQSYGLKVCGVVFCETTRIKKGVAEQTNPEAIEKFGGVPVLGTVPFLKTKSRKEIVNRCDLNITKLTSSLRDTKTKKLAALDKKYMWHPFTQMKDWQEQEPLVIDQADGCYLIDTKGKKYIDGVSSLWVNVHGHRKKELDVAITSQLNRVSHSTLLGLSNTPSIELSKALVDITPKGLNKVFYSDNGSTSVEIGIKMAYQYWQNMGKAKKKQIAHLANSYHGDTLGSVSIGGIDLFHKVYRDLIFKTIKIDFPDCYRAPIDKEYPSYAFECLDKFEKLLEKNHESIAALVVEPIVQGAAGMIVWPKGILKKIAQLCRKYDVFLICDEVATGFGRTGKMFACEHEDVSPDIMCLSKGITGGYLPLAVTLTTDKIYEGFCGPYQDLKTFFHGHTYTGNPLCCAVALENINIFKKEKTLQKLAPKIKFLDKRLKMFYNLASVGDIRQMGFMVGIELVKDKNTKEPYPWEEKIGVRVCQRLREKGIILRPLGNVIVIMPPLVISQTELKRLLDATYDAVEEVTHLSSL